MKTFHKPQYNYCLLTWMFRSRTWNNKINSIYESTLKLVYSDYVSSFDKLLRKELSLSIHTGTAKV